MKKINKLEKTLMGITGGMVMLLVIVVIGALLISINSEPDDSLQASTQDNSGFDQIPGFVPDEVYPQATTEPAATQKQEETDPTETTENKNTDSNGKNNNSSGNNNNQSNNNQNNNQNNNNQNNNNQNNNQNNNNQNNQGNQGNQGSQQTPEATTEPTVPPTQPVVVTPTNGFSDENLYLQALGGYSGNYLEDGTDELVSNVAAILVTNTSDKMLQVAQIVFQVGDGQVAQFQISNLPAGETVLALELTRRPYSSADDFSYGKTASAYMEDPTLESDRVRVDTSKAGELTLENISGETLSEVYVYYKYVQGSSYLGGITYVVPFENVAPGASVTVTAGHFHPDNSQVMDVDIVTE